MLSSALFIGGPADGTLQAFPGPEPPEIAKIQISTPGTLWREAGATLVPEETSTVFEYVRRVNPLDDGPTWIYVPADPDFTDPWRPTP